MSAEITVAGQVNDAAVKAHLAGKFKADKEVASAAAQNEKYGACTLLWWACYGGHKEAVAALLKAGANKNFKSKHGEDCIAIALHKDHDDVVVMLGGKVPPKPAPAAPAAKPAAAAPAAAAKPAAAPAAKPAAAPAPAAKAAPAAAAKPAATPAAAAKPAAAPGKKP